MARSSLTDVEKESLKRPAIVFTDSDSLANTVKKGRWTEVTTKDSELSCLCSEKDSEKAENAIAAVVADTLASRGSSDEDDGKRHSRLVFSTVVRFNLWPRRFMQAKQPQRMSKVAAKTSFNCCSRESHATVLVFVCLL